jgi:hypothetical protein
LSDEANINNEIEIIYELYENSKNKERYKELRSLDTRYLPRK